MPDNNPYIDISVKPGLDDSSLLALKLDTQQRLSKFSAPNVPYGNTVPSYKQYIPDGATQGSVMDGVHSYYDLVQASLSPDRNLRDAAGSIIANKLDTDPISKGVGTSKSIPYDTAMDKYLSKGYGYRPERGGVQGNDDYYYRNVYQNKSFAGKTISNVITGIGRVVVPAVFKAAEGLNYLGHMVGSIGSSNYWADVADNSLSRWLTSTEQKFKDQIMPVYHSIDYNNKGFFSRLTDPTFWTDEVADGAAFMASMVLSNYGVGILGDLVGIGKLGEVPINMASLAKYGKVAGAVGKSADFLLKGAIGSNVSEVGRWLLNTASESAFEASQGYQTSMETLKDARNRGENNLTDSEMKKISGERASARMGANMMILSLSNAVENKFIFNPLFKKLKGANYSEEPGANLMRKPSQSTNPKEWLSMDRKTFNYKTGAGKFLNLKDPNSRLRFYGPRALTTMGMEGLWEENAQLAAERTSGNDNLSWSPFWNQLATQTKNAFKGKDPEAAENIGVGSLIGLLGVTAVNKTFAGNRFLQGERRKISEDTNTAIKDYAIARDEFMSLHDIWQRDDKGVIAKDADGQFQVDNAKVKGVVEGIARFSNKQNAAAQIEQPLLRRHLQNDALADFVFAAKKAGVYRHIVDGFSKVQGLDTKEIENLGFDPSTVNDPKLLKETAEEYGKLYEEAQKSKVKISDVNNTTLKNDILRKHQLYKAYARSRSLTGISQEYQTAIDEGPLPSVFSEEAKAKASDVQRYNSLLFQKRALGEFKDFAKDHNSFYDDYVSSREKEINDGLSQVRPQLLSRIKDGDLGQLKSGLLYSGDRYKGMSDDEAQLSLEVDNANAAKIAELTNSVKQNDYIGQKISHPTMGMPNYVQLAGFQDSIEEKDKKETTVKEEKDGKFTVVSPEGNTVSQHDTKEEAEKVAETTNTEEQTVKTEVQPTPLVPPTPPTGNKDTDVVADTDTKHEGAVVDQKIVSKKIPDEISEDHAVSWFTPLKTSTDDTVDVTGDTEQLTANDYDLARAEFIRRFINNEFEKKYKLFLVNDTFPEVYKEVKDDQGNNVVAKNGDNYGFVASSYAGQIIILENLDGTRPTLSSFFGNNKYKDYSHLPIVFSFNKEAFQKEPRYSTAAGVKAKKEETTISEAKAFYEQEIALGDKARNHLITNPDDKIEITILDSTTGISPKTTYASVQNRFGDFTFDVAVPLGGKKTQTQEVFPGSGIRYSRGTVYAMVGRVSFPVSTAKISTFPDISTKVADTLRYKFPTLELARTVRDQFLSVMVNTDKRRNFFSIDKNDDGTYQITYRISMADEVNSNMTDAAVRRNAPASDVTQANLNVSRVAIKEGYSDFDPSTGAIEFLGTEEYNDFIKPKLMTNLKKILGKDGKLYPETVNPYYSFAINDARIIGTSANVDTTPKSPTEVRQERYDKLKDRVIASKNSPDYNINKIKTSLELELKKNSITIAQYDELIDLATPKLSPSDLLAAAETKEEAKPSSILDKYKNKKDEDIAKIILPEKIQTFDISFNNQKYTYDSYANKVYLLKDGVLIEVTVHSSQFGKVLAEFAKQYPYSETEAGNTGFSKMEVLNKENVKYTFYAPPTSKANSQLILNQLGLMSTKSLSEVRNEMTEEGKQKIDEFLSKYCK